LRSDEAIDRPAWRYRVSPLVKTRSFGKRRQGIIA